MSTVTTLYWLELWWRVRMSSLKDTFFICYSRQYWKYLQRTQSSFLTVTRDYWRLMRFLICWCCAAIAAAISEITSLRSIERVWRNFFDRLLMSVYYRCTSIISQELTLSIRRLQTICETLWVYLFIRRYLLILWLLESEALNDCSLLWLTIWALNQQYNWVNKQCSENRLRTCCSWASQYNLTLSDKFMS